MARLLCSYGAHPRRYHNNQGQTPLALAKYVLRNSKMTKLLASFSPIFSRTSSTMGENEAIPEDSVEIQNSPDDTIVPMELPHETTFRRAARTSTVDGTCSRLQKTSVGIEMIHSNPIEGVEQAEKRPNLCKISGGASISGRPYLHREVKATCALGYYLFSILCLFHMPLWHFKHRNCLLCFAEFFWLLCRRDSNNIATVKQPENLWLEGLIKQDRDVALKFFGGIVEYVAVFIR